MDFCCCICEEEAEGWGNNPEPVVSTRVNVFEEIRDENGTPLLCCDACFVSQVRPARMRTIFQHTIQVVDGGLTKAG